MILIKITKSINIYRLPSKIKQKIKSELTVLNPIYADNEKMGRWNDGIPKYLYMYTVQKGYISVPIGFKETLLEFLNDHCLEFEIIETAVEHPAKFLFKQKLRDYQNEACAELLKYDTGTLSAGTGAGKTTMGLYMMVIRQQKTLIIVHTSALLDQWVDRLQDFLDVKHVEIGIIGGGKFRIGRRVTVALVQSLYNKVDELHNVFGHIIIDECFIAGTLIDGVPIEQLKKGDYVYSFNHSKNRIEKKQITHIFKKQAKELYKLKFMNGVELICTKNHPFFTKEHGYLTVSDLLETEYTDINFLIIGADNAKKDKNEVHGLWEKNSLFWIKTLAIFFRHGECWKGKMFRRMYTKSSGGITQKIRSIFKKIQSKTCVKKNERDKPNARQKNNRENEKNKKGKWNTKQMAWFSWWKWATDKTTKNTIRIIIMGDRNSNNNTKRKKKEIQIPKLLQGRYWKSIFKNSSRSGWKRAQHKTNKAVRYEKGKMPKWTRLDSVSIYKRGDSCESKKMHEKNTVYNIEVQDNNNYFANDILVHNCHRTPGRTFIDAVSNLKSRYKLGLSATPYRRDNLTKLIFWFAGPVRHIVPKKYLVDEGYILMPKVIRKRTDFDTDINPIKQYSKMLSALTKDDKRNNQIALDVADVLKNTNDTIIILSDRKSHCELLQNSIFVNSGIEIPVLTGATDKRTKNEIVNQIGKKNRGFIATGQLVGEGFDCPDLNTLFLATPISFDGRLLQYIGRIMRPAKGKKNPLIYDYIDVNIKQLRNSAKRRLTAYGKENIIQ